MSGLPEPVAWAMEWGAVSLPAGHVSRITCIEAHESEAEAQEAAEKSGFDSRVFSLYTADQMREAIAKAVADEREACAAVAESWDYYGCSVASIGPRISAAIRGRK